MKQRKSLRLVDTRFDDIKEGDYLIFGLDSIGRVIEKSVTWIHGHPYIKVGFITYSYRKGRYILERNTYMKEHNKMFMRLR